MTTVYDCQVLEISKNILENETQADPPNDTVPGHWDVTFASGAKMRFQQHKVYDLEGNPTDDDILHSFVGSPVITSMTARECGGGETTYTTDSAP